MPKVIDSALAGANAAAGPMFRTMLPCVLICAQIGAAPALADSKSSAEFMLTTCLAAMDDLAKVEAIAGKNNWTVRTSPISAAMSKFVTSKSMWEVTEAEDQFYVMTWMSHIGENLPPRKVCSVMFRGNNVNREEFFNFVSASVELTFMSDTRFPQTRSETYGVKSDRTTKLMLGITSRSDGILTMAILQEIVWSAH